MRVDVANDDTALTLFDLAGGEMFSTPTRACLSYEQDCELLSMDAAEGLELVDGVENECG